MTKVKTNLLTALFSSVVYLLCVFVFGTFTVYTWFVAATVIPINAFITFPLIDVIEREFKNNGN